MSEPHVIITLQTIYDKLVDVERKVDPLPQQVTDHESRIRALEKRVWGWTALSGGGGGIIGAVLTQIINGG